MGIGKSGNEQKVAIITGASQGIGAGLVKAYRDNGFVVVANSRSIKPSSDEGVIAIAGNIGNRKVAAQVVNLAVERFGRIDTLTNNVGIIARSVGSLHTKVFCKRLTNYTADNVGCLLRLAQAAS